MTNFAKQHFAGKGKADLPPSLKLRRANKVGLYDY